VEFFSPIQGLSGFSRPVDTPRKNIHTEKILHTFTRIPPTIVFSWSASSNVLIYFNKIRQVEEAKKSLPTVGVEPATFLLFLFSFL
jgi:hypothetical protein